MHVAMRFHASVDQFIQSIRPLGKDGVCSVLFNFQPVVHRSLTRPKSGKIKDIGLNALIKKGNDKPIFRWFYLLISAKRT